MVRRPGCFIKTKQTKDAKWSYNLFNRIPTEFIKAS